MITHRLRFVIYLERDLTPDVELEEVLSLSARGSFELYLTKEQLLTLIYRGSVNDNREDAIILFG